MSIPDNMKSWRVCVDRVVPANRIQRHVELSLAENPHNRPAHLNMDRFRAADLMTKLEMAMPVSAMWAPGRTLRIRFLDGKPSVQRRVQAVALEWTACANLDLQFVADGDADIRISFTDHGSWSYVGTESLSVPISSPTMNFGWLDDDTREQEYRRVVLHEFGHALGCIHEHESPTADGLRWNKEAVYAYFGQSPNFWSKQEVDVNIFNRYARAGTNFTRLDVTSIMMYQFPEELFRGGFSTPDNHELSQLDKAFMASSYPGGRVVAIAAKMPTGNALLDIVNGVDLSRLTRREAFKVVQQLKIAAEGGSGRSEVPSRSNGVGVLPLQDD
jgi:hypothetical protein